jgi:hypothetical protein
MASLGIEVTYLLLKYRRMQAVADSAAMAAAAAIAGGYPALMGVEAAAVASSSGFTPGAAGVTLTVNNPPLAGGFAGQTGAAELVLAQPQGVFLARVLWDGAFTLKVRSVAKIGASGSSYCALQLDSTAPVGVAITNGATANFATCGLAVNATSNTALTMSGNAKLTTTSVSVVGGSSVTNGASINPASALKTAQPSVADPYVAVPHPTVSGCAGGTSRNYGWGNWTMTPGVYCQGVSMGNGAVVTMNPGVYIIDRGSFDVGGGVTLTGTGVTIFLTSSTGSGYATSTVGNGAGITLSAPTSGATAGLLFFGDRRAPASNSNNFAGGVAINVTGALYFPSAKLTFENGSSNPSGCTQLIAGVLVFQGGSKFQNVCPAGVKVIAASAGASKLVE